MTGVTGINANALTTAPTDNRAQLRRLADELESVFLNQLFQAMRQSVPDGGLGTSSPGEEMFTAMLDEQLAKEAAFKWERGLGEELYRQLSRRLIDHAPAESL
jgi:Rod binding domain-containing protein